MLFRPGGGTDGITTLKKAQDTNLEPGSVKMIPCRENAEEVYLDIFIKAKHIYVSFPFADPLEKDYFCSLK